MEHGGHVRPSYYDAVHGCVLHWRIQDFSLGANHGERGSANLYQEAYEEVWGKPPTRIQGQSLLKLMAFLHYWTIFVK